MREILFRGKRIENGEWVYGCYVNQENKHIIFEKESTWHHYIDKNTLGQYTGLKDKNGTKIFEDDIVEVTIKYEEYDWDGKYKKYTQKLIGKVIYEKNAFVINSKTRTLDFIDKKYVEIQRDGITYYYTYKVIGNIHDNSELLEG